jgi:hypothetical protein
MFASYAVPPADGRTVLASVDSTKSPIRLPNPDAEVLARSSRILALRKPQPSHAKSSPWTSWGRRHLDPTVQRI